MRLQYPPPLPVDPPRETSPRDGGVNGLYPPRFSTGAAGLMPRCGSGRELLVFPPNERLFELGGVNGRNPPRF